MYSLFMPHICSQLLVLKFFWLVISFVLVAVSLYKLSAVYSVKTKGGAVSCWGIRATPLNKK